MKSLVPRHRGVYLCIGMASPWVGNSLAQNARELDVWGVETPSLEGPSPTTPIAPRPQNPLQVRGSSPRFLSPT